jgi:cystathionine beta-synthase
MSAVSALAPKNVHSTREGVLALIGNTPMLKVTRMDTGLCELYLKLECQNPGGSIKDRIGLSMIEAAEAEGKLKAGGVLIEATAGNTGLGLAQVALSKGYRMVLVIPDKMSREKIHHLRAMGVEIIMTRSDVGKGHPEYYHDLAASIAKKTPGSFLVNQFENPANPAAHEHGTGPEIWEQMEHKLDAVVVGVGSGGTLGGLQRYFAKTDPNVEMVLADPEGSILAPYINTGIMGEAGSWLVEGIGEDFVPIHCDLSTVKHAYAISDKESLNTARELLEKEGILGGSSTGTLLAAALRFCREQKTPKRVVSFVCDSGNKYLSKMYNPYWMEEHGFTPRESHGDLRDVIARPYQSGSTVVVKPDDVLSVAYGRMKLHDVSQLPVMANDKLLGIIDESDILLAAMDQKQAFSLQVKEVMSKNLQTVDFKKPIDALLPFFAKGMVVIVTEGERFLGLITQIDLLHYLRQRGSI